MLTKYVQEQQGCTIYDTYIDDGISSTDFNRPGVQRMLDDAKNGNINLILVKDLSRFGRNYIQVGQYTDYIFPMYNIRFIALNDNIDTANSDSTSIDDKNCFRSIGLFAENIAVTDYNFRNIYFTLFKINVRPFQSTKHSCCQFKFISHIYTEFY